MCYICSIIKKRKEMDTLRKAHEIAAKHLRNAKFEARLFKNYDMPHQPFEVRVKGITKEVAMELQSMMCKVIKCDVINIIEC